ncbi:MAG: septal ring lytic transglycosylase RlpA family protein [Bacteroidetes bacterium]|nr:septal ring lytic transglycosylase RlpA family protein [Bacteroidota bacterium]
MATFAFTNLSKKQMKLLFFIFFSLFSLASVSAQQTDLQKDTIQTDSLRTDRIQQDSLVTVKGKATYYASKFHGRRTSNGEIFSNKKMTAAHLKLPFGTLVSVTNPENGRTVQVRVNDRGPHTKAYIIDVSQAAAKELGFYGKGVANVEISYQVARK